MNIIILFTNRSKMKRGTQRAPHALRDFAILHPFVNISFRNHHFKFLNDYAYRISQLLKITTLFERMGLHLTDKPWKRHRIVRHLRQFANEFITYVRDFGKSSILSFEELPTALRIAHRVPPPQETENHPFTEQQAFEIEICRGEKQFGYGVAG